MELIEAVDILVEAVKIGQAQGIYSLQDARIIANAIDVLVPSEYNDNDINITEENIIEQTTSENNDTTKYIDTTIPKSPSKVDKYIQQNK